MHQPARRSTRPEPAGLIIHGAARYDAIVWLFTLGRERRFRKRMLDLAQLQQGETVIDIGCGTGALAMLAKHQVGPQGAVHGVDASPEMIARARQKAQRARLDVAFTEAAAQALPLADGQVDVVLSTLMLHHVPRKARPEVIAEIRRVLRPGGRFLAVDFGKPAAGKRSVTDRWHRHGFIKLDDISADLDAAGLQIIRSGPVGEKNLHFVLASAGPLVAHAANAGVMMVRNQDAMAPNAHRDRGHRMVIVGIALAVLALIALHAAGASLLMGQVLSLASTPFAYALIALAVVLAILKIGFLGAVHRFADGALRRWLRIGGVEAGD